MARKCNMPANDPSHIASRYRMLTTEQQEYVSDVLNSAAKRCMVNAEKARQDASSRPEPFGAHRGAKSIEHASNAGALNIVDLLLVALGQSGGPVPPSLIPAICPNCGGHGRLPCPCLPEKYEDVAELVGKPNCGNCWGDGDALCPRCFGRGAVLSVMGPNEAKGVQIEETELARMQQEWHLDRERVAEARQELGRLRDALIFISQQFCQRTDRGDVRVCPESGDCLTEWCLPCYAGAIVNYDDES